MIIVLIKKNRLSHNVVISDEVRDVSTAYSESSSADFSIGTQSSPVICWYATAMIGEFQNNLPLVARCHMAILLLCNYFCGY